MFRPIQWENNNGWTVTIEEAEGRPIVYFQTRYGSIVDIKPSDWPELKAMLDTAFENIAQTEKFKEATSNG